MEIYTSEEFSSTSFHPSFPYLKPSTSDLSASSSASSSSSSSSSSSISASRPTLLPPSSFLPYSSSTGPPFPSPFLTSLGLSPSTNAPSSLRPFSTSSPTSSSVSSGMDQIQQLLQATIKAKQATTTTASNFSSTSTSSVLFGKSNSAIKSNGDSSPSLLLPSGASSSLVEGSDAMAQESNVNNSTNNALLSPPSYTPPFPHFQATQSSRLNSMSNQTRPTFSATTSSEIFSPTFSMPSITKHHPSTPTQPFQTADSSNFIDSSTELSNLKSYHNSSSMLLQSQESSPAITSPRVVGEMEKESSSHRSLYSYVSPFSMLDACIDQQGLSSTLSPELHPLSPTSPSQTNHADVPSMPLVDTSVPLSTSSPSSIPVVLEHPLAHERAQGLSRRASQRLSSRSLSRSQSRSRSRSRSRSQRSSLLPASGDKQLVFQGSPVTSQTHSPALLPTNFPMFHGFLDSIVTTPELNSVNAPPSKIPDYTNMATRRGFKHSEPLETSPLNPSASLYSQPKYPSEASPPPYASSMLFETHSASMDVGSTLSTPSETRNTRKGSTTLSLSSSSTSSSTSHLLPSSNTASPRGSNPIHLNDPSNPLLDRFPSTLSSPSSLYPYPSEPDKTLVVSLAQGEEERPASTPPEGLCEHHVDVQSLPVTAWDPTPMFTYATAPCSALDLSSDTLAYVDDHAMQVVLETLITKETYPFSSGPVPVKQMVMHESHLLVNQGNMITVYQLPPNEVQFTCAFVFTSEKSSTTTADEGVHVRHCLVVGHATLVVHVTLNVPTPSISYSSLHPEEDPYEKKEEAYLCVLDLNHPSKAGDAMDPEGTTIRVLLSPQQPCCHLLSEPLVDLTPAGMGSYYFTSSPSTITLWHRLTPSRMFTVPSPISCVFTLSRSPNVLHLLVGVNHHTSFWVIALSRKTSVSSHVASKVHLTSIHPWIPSPFPTLLSKPVRAHWSPPKQSEENEEEEEEDHPSSLRGLRPQFNGTWLLVPILPLQEGMDERKKEKDPQGSQEDELYSLKPRGMKTMTGEGRFVLMQWTPDHQCTHVHAIQTPSWPLAMSMNSTHVVMSLEKTLLLFPLPTAVRSVSVSLPTWSAPVHFVAHSLRPSSSTPSSASMAASISSKAPSNTYSNSNFLDSNTTIPLQDAMTFSSSASSSTTTTSSSFVSTNLPPTSSPIPTTTITKSQPVHSTIIPSPTLTSSPSLLPSSVITPREPDWKQYVDTKFHEFQTHFDHQFQHHHDHVNEALSHVTHAWTSHLNDVQQGLQKLTETLMSGLLHRPVSQPDITQSVLDGLLPNLRQAIQHHFVTTLIPAYERATQEMFQQLANALSPMVALDEAVQKASQPGIEERDPNTSFSEVDQETLMMTRRSGMEVMVPTHSPPRPPTSPSPSLPMTDADLLRTALNHPEHLNAVLHAWDLERVLPTLPVPLLLDVVMMMDELMDPALTIHVFQLLVHMLPSVPTQLPSELWEVLNQCLLKCERLDRAGSTALNFQQRQAVWVLCHDLRRALAQ
ncbi:hypothetical protein HMI54_015209 [Coelomomyces lativittatus]|nr:hypothetical protein HMI54_015209 [Coelomomyces lativittatus]KAJ1514780.1 hypothetical protein HMI55_004364 [Coelomomyces lativittatus]